MQRANERGEALEVARLAPAHVVLDPDRVEACLGGHSKLGLVPAEDRAGERPACGIFPGRRLEDRRLDDPAQRQRHGQ